MFRITSIIGFAVILGGIVIHSLLCPCGTACRLRPIDIIRKYIHVFTLLFFEQKLSWLGILRKASYLVAMFCFCVLLITGFAPVVLGSRIAGYILMIHATFAPVFVVCSAFCVLTAAGRFGFAEAELDCFLNLFSRRRQSPQNSSLMLKITFWLLALLILPLAGSSVLSMFPILGTAGQEFLFQLHRWTALLLSFTALIHIYLMIRFQIRKTTE